LRQTASVLYIAIDSLVSARGTFLPGLDEFTAALDHRGIPSVWLTSRSRLHLDEPRRKLGHAHPFIAEDGCAIYLPEDYFHLRPSSASSRAQKSATLRLGRFTCVPIAEILPAASEALESLSQDTRVPIVTLRSLSPRELAQNTGLPAREAALARQRDFDDLFFFAGVSEREIQRFLEEGRSRNLQFRPHGVLWSAAIGASIQRCISELSKLYDRALRYHARSIGIAKDEASVLFSFCERAILLAGEEPQESLRASPGGRRVQFIAFHTPEDWDQLLEAIVSGN
jgi:predicted mannosyl-3-phosphoglycerate phosphatase (HAD superfamily)